MPEEEETASTETADKTDKTDKPKGAVVLAVLVFVLVLVVGAIGFTVSWDNLFDVAKPAFPGELEIASWKVAWAHSIPAVVDGGILALTLMRLWNAVNGRRLPIASWILNGLIATTIVVNATAGTDKLSVLLHALPATVYVAVSEMFIHSILKRYKTIEEKEESTTRGVSLARWVLAPFSTFIMWRVMTICSTHDLSVFVRLERVRVAQHQTWRTNKGVAWWLPMIGVSRADRMELRMRMLELSVAIENGTDTTPEPPSPLAERGEHPTVSTPVASTSERPAVSEHPSGEHFGERPGEHRSERRTVSVPAAREHVSKRVVSASVTKPPSTASTEATAPEGDLPEVPGVPHEAVSWIVAQWLDPSRTEELTGSDVAAKFDKGLSTGRRYLNTTKGHLPEQLKHLNPAAV